jgi:hypothetical protein
LRSDPASSIQASEPPPAPMVLMSMLGKQIGWPYSMNHSRVIVRVAGVDQRDIGAGAAHVKADGMLEATQVAMYLLATAPAAMPEPARRAACRSTVFGVITPPPLCRSSRSLS